MNDTAGGGWSSLPGGKRRGRGKRGCRGGTFDRVRSTGGVREKRGSRHGAGCERGFLVYRRGKTSGRAGGRGRKGCREWGV